MVGQNRRKTRGQTEVRGTAEEIGTTSCERKKWPNNQSCLRAVERRRNFTGHVAGKGLGREDLSGYLNLNFAMGGHSLRRTKKASPRLEENRATERSFHLRPAKGEGHSARG